MEMFIQKCIKLEAKISLHKEKEDYKQTHSSCYFSVAA